MADLGPQIVGGVIALVGTGLGLGGGMAVERMRSADARAARNEARQQQQDDFQRQTLIAFQEVIGRYARANGRAWHHDEMEFRRSGRWMATLLSDDVDHEVFESGRDARQLVQRVRDDEVRSRFDAYHSALSRASVPIRLAGQTDAQRYEAAQAEHVQVAALQVALEDRIGEVVRRLL